MFLVKPVVSGVWEHLAETNDKFRSIFFFYQFHKNVYEMFESSQVYQQNYRHLFFRSALLKLDFILRRKKKITILVNLHSTLSNKTNVKEISLPLVLVLKKKKPGEQR